MAKEQKLFLADPPMAREIEDYRFKHRYRSEGAALRDIVRAGLDALRAAETHQEQESLQAA